MSTWTAANSGVEKLAVVRWMPSAGLPPVAAASLLALVLRGRPHVLASTGRPNAVHDHAQSASPLVSLCLL